jgi:hypothetical protein
MDFSGAIMPMITSTLPTTPSTMAVTVPPIPAGTPLMGDPFNPFGFLVALGGLILPTIFYLVWIAVGVAVLIYLVRLLRKP